MAKAVRSSLNDLSGTERRQFWATVFGINGPEWMIILALADADEFTADTTVISEMLNVNPSFVLACARRLEKQGHVHRTGQGKNTKLSLTAAAMAKLTQP
jgi:MarR family transcriptional regulator, organic hydroperoxide resistance regulator